MASCLARRRVGSVSQLLHASLLFRFYFLLLSGVPGSTEQNRTKQEAQRREIERLQEGGLVGLSWPMIHWLVVCPVVNVACHLTVLLPHSHVKQAWRRFWRTAAFLCVTFPHHDLEVRRLLNHSD